MPEFGAVRIAPCTWCRRDCRQVWAASPDSPGGFWDHSACSCGSFAGMATYGLAIARNHARDNVVGTKRKYRDGRRRA